MINADQAFDIRGLPDTARGTDQGGQNYNCGLSYEAKIVKTVSSK
jgi:hypothetical protein